MKNTYRLWDHTLSMTTMFSLLPLPYWFREYIMTQFCGLFYPSTLLPSYLTYALINRKKILFIWPQPFLKLSLK